MVRVGERICRVIDCVMGGGRDGGCASNVITCHPGSHVPLVKPCNPKTQPAFCARRNNSIH